MIARDRVLAPGGKADTARAIGVIDDMKPALLMRGSGFPIPAMSAITAIPAIFSVSAVDVISGYGVLRPRDRIPRLVGRNPHAR